MRNEARKVAKEQTQSLDKQNLLDKLKNWQACASQRDNSNDAKLRSIESAANLLAPSFPNHSGHKVMKHQRFGHNPAAAANMITATRRFTMQQASQDNLRKIKDEETAFEQFI